MKKILVIGLTALVHFGLTRIVQASVLAIGSSSTFSMPRPLMERLLVPISKILYFPVISLALYPRQLFPGDFILIPIFFNSLVWALGLCSLWAVVRRRIPPDTGSTR